MALEGNIFVETTRHRAQQERDAPVFAHCASTGEALSLDTLDWGMAGTSEYEMMIMQQSHFFVCMRLVAESPPLLLPVSERRRLRASA